MEKPSVFASGYMALLMLHQKNVMNFQLDVKLPRPRTWTIMLESAMHDLSYEACQAYGFVFTMRNPGAYFGNLANYVVTRLGLSIVIVDGMGDGKSG